MKKFINFLLIAIAFAITAIFSTEIQSDDFIGLMAAPLISTNYMRSRFMAFVDMLQTEGILPGGLNDNPIITETSLRMKATLPANPTTLNFNLKKGTDTDASDERRLPYDNIFFATHIGLYLQKYRIGGTYQGDKGNYPLFTYPDGNYFVTAATAAAASEADALNTVYDGKLTFNTAGVDRMIEMLTEDLKFVPDKQHFIGGGSLTDQVDDEYPQWGPSLAEKGWFELHGSQAIFGKLDNKFTLTLGEGDKTAIAGTADVGNQVVLKIHGFEFSGSFAQGKGRVC